MNSKQLDMQWIVNELNMAIKEKNEAEGKIKVLTRLVDALQGDSVDATKKEEKGSSPKK